MKVSLAQARRFIEKEGALLVFPINNRPEPLSLWKCFFPRTPMRWEWDESGDNRVAELWHLREELSRSGKVVYAKWYQGRATFFSKAIFPALLRILNAEARPLSREAQQILDLLEEDSPLSTKELKAATDLKGKVWEGAFNRTMQELWRRLLIVGYGERDDGAFPSLLQGSTQLLFEKEWRAARDMSVARAWESLRKQWGEEAPWLRFLERQRGVERSL